MLPKTGGCAAGTAVEIAKGVETGGGVTWGEISFVCESQSLQNCLDY